MNYKVVLYMLGKISLACGGSMLLPLLVALWYGEPSVGAFGIAVSVCVLWGQLLILQGKPVTQELTNREGILITSLGWIMVTFLGMIPYTAGGYANVLDGIFESISGLSGTGSTIMADLEILPQSILLWRALTHWIGGLGIIVIFIALFPQLGRGMVHMFNAESTGPKAERTMPRIKEMAKALFYVYAAFTAVATAACMLCGMSFVVALSHAFATIATGGFSPYNDSVAHFHSPVIEGVLAFFMLISSANFGMYVAAWHRGFQVIVKDTEFRTYLAIVATATIGMALNLMLQQGWNGSEAFRQAFFQSVSISSSTGFVSSDFEVWPSFSKCILLFLMFVGGCAGSTAGGLKITRLLILCHVIRVTVQETLHPRMVYHVRSNGEDFSADVIYGVVRFFFVYMALDVLWSFLLIWDGVPAFDAIGVSISAMGSCGPAFGMFGATCTYADMPAFSKGVICLAMLMGRLESFTVLAILMPSFWRRQFW